MEKKSYFVVLKIEDYDGQSADVEVLGLCDTHAKAEAIIESKFQEIIARYIKYGDTEEDFRDSVRRLGDTWVYEQTLALTTRYKIIEKELQ